MARNDCAASGCFEVALSSLTARWCWIAGAQFVAMMRADWESNPKTVVAMEISLPRESYEDKAKRLDFFSSCSLALRTCPV